MFHFKSATLSTKRIDYVTHEKELHMQLSKFNHERLSPGFIQEDWRSKIEREADFRFKEGEFLEKERHHIQQYLVHMPREVDAFMCWFENLKQDAPGQGDILFPWLAREATLQQLRWFLQQEAAGEAGFDDLVALTQVKLPIKAKLELARNYWDEMGRGHENSVHGLLLDKVVKDLQLAPTIEDTAWESLALANLMLGLSLNRRYAYQSIGALGAVEMTAPNRVKCVNESLKRLNVPFDTRKYYQLHATLDIKHSHEWNKEVIYSLVKSNPQTAKPIAEGALMRLNCGAKCYKAYKKYFGIQSQIL